MVFVQNAYDGGVQEPIIRTASGNFTDGETTKFSITPIDLLQYQIMKQLQNSTVAEFTIRNNDNATNVSWSMNTGTTTVNATNGIALNRSQFVIVIAETNYTISGVYMTTGTANSSTNKDNATGVAVV